MRRWPRAAAPGAAACGRPAPHPIFLLASPSLARRQKDRYCGLEYCNCSSNGGPGPYPSSSTDLGASGPAGTPVAIPALAAAPPPAAGRRLLADSASACVAPYSVLDVQKYGAGAANCSCGQALLDSVVASLPSELLGQLAPTCEGSLAVNAGTCTDGRSPAITVAALHQARSRAGLLGPAGPGGAGPTPPLAGGRLRVRAARSRAGERGGGGSGASTLPSGERAPSVGSGTEPLGFLSPTARRRCWRGCDGPRSLLLMRPHGRWGLRTPSTCRILHPCSQRCVLGPASAAPPAAGAPVPTPTNPLLPPACHRSTF